MTEQYAREIISMYYPNAKFGAFVHTDSFLEPEAQIGPGYYYVSLYDERIESNRIKTPEGIIIIGNTYISSFTYNLVLAWIYETTKGSVSSVTTSPIIKYNFKKFFAEQLYHRYNNVFSRAVLLETLLYEQHLMIPVFVETEINDDKSAIAKSISGAMSNFVLFHEVGHYYLQYLPESIDEIFNQNKKLITPFLEALSDQYNVPFVEEVKCDIFSVYLKLMQDKQDKIAMRFSLRAAILGYVIMAILYALQGSAQIIADEHKKTPDKVDLNSIETSTQEYSFVLDIPVDNRSAEMELRATLMIALCELIAKSEDIELYGDEKPLPLEQNIFESMKSYVHTIMSESNKNERAIARLVAEGFHNYPEGMEYLYLKSKVFKSQRRLEL